MSVFNVVTKREDAVVPSKAHATDAGFDVTITHLIKEVGDVQFYGTGVHVEPPTNIYFMLAPRSSISKTGYMLANGVGIIDTDYRGEIIVALRKMTPDAVMELPCRIAQLIPTYVIPMDAVVVSEFGSDTERGSGGFGSTGTA